MTLKLKLQIFVLIAVLSPFGVLAYFAYSHSLRINQARFGQELQSLGALVALEVNRHTDRFVDDIKVFASAPLLHQATMGDKEALQRVNPYFDSLPSRFSELQQFSLADAEGWPVISVGPEESRRLTRRESVVIVMERVQGPLIRVTVPIADGTESTSGYLVADIGLEILRPFLRTGVGKRLYLVSNEIRVLDSSEAVHLSTPVTTDERKRIFGYEDVLHYQDHRGVTVLGLLEPTRIDGLHVLAEMDADAAFAELRTLKTHVAWILAAVLSVLMIAAHVFGTALIRPLKALIDGARRVADGDLDIDLPAGRRDEIGYLSQVFNDMVDRLQESRRAEQAAQARLVEQNRCLAELTATDNLTGLANRRSLVENLTLHLDRYKRNRRPFSVLMLDLDNFKRTSPENRFRKACGQPGLPSRRRRHSLQLCRQRWRL